MEGSSNGVVNSEIGAQKPVSVNSGKIPWQLQLAAALMWFSGIACILRGMRMLWSTGFGLILVGLVPIIIGLVIIKYARQIVRMQKKGYMGAMIIMGLSFVGALISVLLPGRDEGIYLFLNIVTLVVDGLPLAILYQYREKFVG